MATNMREVASRAGVSVATVFYVLNQGPRPVSPPVRDRVLAAVEELGYVRPRRTRKRSLTVGVIVPDVTNSFFSQALAGVESVLRKAGHVMLAGSSGENAEAEANLIERLLRRGVDGLILTPGGRIPAEVEGRAERGLKVVVMDRDGGSQAISSVAMDNYGSAFSAVRLLIETGHRRIALVNGPESVSTARDRRRGYEDALAFGHLRVEPAYVRSGPFRFEHGREATLSLLSHEPPPAAIFSSSAILTPGVLAALRERRLSWPADVAVVGFGDAVWAQLVTPALTVVEQPVFELGRRAAQMLLSQSGRQPSEQHVVLQSRLVLRDSHWRAVVAADPAAEAS